MANNKITVSFRLFSFGTVLTATVFSSIFNILYLWANADIMVNDIFAYTFFILSALFSLLTTALIIVSSTYAHSYFGIKTTLRVSLISLACMALGKAILFVYNLIVNDLSSSQLISAALSYTVEIFSDSLYLLLFTVISIIFASLRQSSKGKDPDTKYSPIKAALFSAGIYCICNSLIIPAIDLTFKNVIPFIKMYDNITSGEIRSILLDYLYVSRFFPIYLAVLIALVPLTHFTLTKITGKLVPKKRYASPN